jgi:hypothetical protein
MALQETTYQNMSMAKFLCSQRNGPLAALESTR